MFVQYNRLYFRQLFQQALEIRKKTSLLDERFKGSGSNHNLMDINHEKRTKLRTVLIPCPYVGVQRESLNIEYQGIDTTAPGGPFSEFTVSNQASYVFRGCEQDRVQGSKGPSGVFCL